MNETLYGWENIKNKYNKIENNLDLIIVLAGGLNEEGNLHEWVIRRLDRAIELHKLHDCPILCSGGGTYHKPPFINEKGFVVHESTECVNYMCQQGINKNNIYREWSSYDTIANAFFSLTTHVLFYDYKTIGIITSEFHISRSQEIFNWIFGFKNCEQQKYQLIFFPVTDLGLDENMLSHRREREAKSKENVLILKEKIKTLKDFTKWLYSEHNAYNNNFLKENITEECKKTY